jgi:lipopolysaccharide export system permease protein
MRLLDRYFLRELLIPLGYCLGGLLVLWIAFDVYGNLNEFQRDGLLGWDIAEYYLVEAPEILVVILPVTLLLALLYSLTNHARHNEITAARVAGVSLWRLVVPYLGVGLLISLGSFALNELCVPKSAEAAKRILTRRLGPGSGLAEAGEARELAFRNERDRRDWVIGLYNTDTGEMLNPVVGWHDAEGSYLQILARRAARVNGVWTFYDVEEFKTDIHTNLWPGPVLETNLLAMPEFSETPEQIKSEIKISSSLALPGTGKTKKSDMSVAEILNYLRLHPHPSLSSRCWLYTKLHGRLAAPWTCVVVVLIAIPFGAVSGGRNVFMGVAGSIVICFAYFVVQQFALVLGASGYLAPWLAGWLPNLSFGLTGLGLTARIR